MDFDPSTAVLDEPAPSKGFDPSTAVLDDTPSFDPSTAVLDEEQQPTTSARAYLPAPGEGMSTVKGSVLTDVPQAFPVQEQAKSENVQLTQSRQQRTDEIAKIHTESQAALEARATGVAQPESEIQPIGKPGTLLRGATSVAAAVLNRPEYLAALGNPATATAVGAYFLPQVAKQFTEDFAAGIQGDNEALGRAAAIGVPALIGGVKGGKTITERLEAQTQLEHLQKASSAAHIDALAREGLSPQNAQWKIKPKEAPPADVVAEPSTLAKLPEVPVEHERVLPGATETFKETVGVKEAQKAEFDPATAVPEETPVLDTVRQEVKEFPQEEQNQPSEPTKQRRQGVERPPDIIDFIQENFGGIRGKKHAREGSEGYYGSGYDEAKNGAGRQLFSKSGQSPDEVLDGLRREGYMSENATVDDLWDAIGKANGSRRAHFRGETPEVMADKFYNALTKQGEKKSSHIISVGDLGVGDKFVIGGEKLEVVSINPDTGEVTVKDGRKFGYQTIPDGADVPIEKGSLEAKSKAPVFNENEDFGFEPIESVEQQKARLAREEAAAKEKEQKAAMEDAAAKPLVGSVGDIGQKDMFGGGNLFSEGPGMVGMGGATPSEFTPSPKRQTGIKNASIDLQRQERGLPPITKPLKETWQDAWDRAMARMDANPELQDILIRELKNKPRTATTEENVILTQRLADLRNELDKARREQFQAQDDGRLEAAADAQLRADEWSNKLTELEQITELAGTWAGRGLNARKIMLNDDFSLAKLEMKARESLGEQRWNDLNQRKTALEEARRTAEEWQKNSKELEAKLADKDRLLAEEQMARAHAEMQAQSVPQYEPRVLKMAEDFATWMDKKGNDALNRLKERMRGVSSADPTIIADMAILGAAKLTRKIVDFAKWSDAMVRDLGDWAKPYLNEAYDASQKKLEEDLGKFTKPHDKVTAGKVKKAVERTPVEKADKIEEKIRERVKSGDKQIDILVQKLARAFVEAGEKQREPLIDKVHEVIKDIMPEDWTRRDTMDAISGYGSMKLLSKDAISTTLRDLKGQMQQIGKLEDMAAGQAPSKTGLERRTPSDAEKELIRLVNEAKRKGGYETANPDTQLKSALDTVKTRMRTQIKDLEQKLKNKDFTKKTPAEIKLDDEALTIRHKLDKIKREWHAKMLENKLANENVAQKAIRKGAEILNVFRAIRTSFDLSAVLRQGKFVVMQHPILGAKAIPPMLKAFWNEKYAFDVDHKILNRPNYPVYQRAGLYLAEHGVPLSRMEEAYMSRWAEKIPVVAGSQRAYTTFLNKLRADVFDVMAETLGEGGKLTNEQAKVAANAINVFTGRGSIGTKQDLAVGLNTLFFAPRYVASRFQTAIGQPIWHGMFSGKVGFKNTGKIRGYIATEYAKLLIGYSIIYGLAHAAGYKIGIDPRSSDFGKIIDGKTRIDPLAGVSQAVVIALRTITGKKTNAKGRIVPLVGKLPYGSEDLMDVWKTFLRTKLAPAPGFAIDMKLGENVIGQPVPYPTEDPVEFFLKYIGPISFADIEDTMIEQGVPKGTALTILSLFGESVQTYDKIKK